MTWLRSLAQVSCLAACLFASTAFAAAPKAAAPAKSNPTAEAMGVLKANCLSCHNEKKKKGGLMLTSRESLLKGSDEGPVLMPGKPDRSRLIQVLATSADPHMPPKKQLADAQIRALRKWVQQGAAWDAVALSEFTEPLRPVTLGRLPVSYHPVLALALAPDGNRLAAACGNQVVIYDLAHTNHPVLTRLAVQPDAVQSLDWSSDNHWLAAGAFRRLTVWDTGDFPQSTTVTNGLRDRISAVRFLPDSKTLLAADGSTGQAGTVLVLEVPSGKLMNSWSAHTDTIFDFSVSRDGKLLATAGGDKLVKIWDLSTRKEISRLEGHTAQVMGVAFNTNSTQLVSAGADKQLKVWDLTTRERIITLGNHTAALNAVSWSPRGDAIVAVNDTGVTFRYTDLKAHTGAQSSDSATQRQVGTAADALYCVITDSTGERIFAGSHDGTVHIWNQGGKQLARLKVHEQSSEPIATNAR